jgi:hypothetical protein
MFFDWHGRPALMMPTLAYTVTEPEGPWIRASARDIDRHAEELTADEFRIRFARWHLPPFPTAFAELDGSVRLRDRIALSHGSVLPR